MRIPSPAFSVGGVGTKHMIVGEEVLVAEILSGLSVVSDYFRVAVPISLCGKVTPTARFKVVGLGGDSQHARSNLGRLGR
jgi:hypothetical protein